MAPSVEALEKHLRDATRELYAAEPSTVTVNSVRQRAEELNDLEKGFFVTQDWKARSKALITEYVQGLIANDPPSSAPEPKVEQDTKHGMKRSSSDEPSPSPAAKRHKKASSATASRNTKPKKESSSSALSELSDSDVEPKKDNKKTTGKAAGRKQESESELSDLDSSEDEPRQKEKAKNPTISRKSKKEESESELSDLSSPDDKPKPTKKRGRRSRNLKDSDDDRKDTGAKASTSRLKRKQPTATKKRSTKRTKVESDSDDQLDVKNSAEKKEVKVNTNINGNPAARDEDSEEETKPDKKASKSSADDSDSSLSSVLDEPPPKKRRGKNTKEAPKPKQPASKEVTGDEAEIKKLQGHLVKCGVRKVWGVELKQYGSDGKAKIRHLRDMLRDVGMDGRFSEAKAREIKERRELIGELEAVNEMNELWGLEGRGGRASRSKAVRKSLKEESDEADDDDKQKQIGDDEKDVKVNSTSRVSKRMADLAFLGSDSESE